MYPHKMHSVPKLRKPTDFTIEALVGKDCESRTSSPSIDENRDIDFKEKLSNRTAFQPVLPGSLLHPGQCGPSPYSCLPSTLLGNNTPHGLGTIYPWLFTRHPAFLSHRFPVHDAGFLLPNFRKPKRIRTAFSPSQLLRLEHAFEKNHYVVGQERKELASALALTETQVKVWFQNRRTKYKRMKAEEDEGGMSGMGGRLHDGLEDTSRLERRDSCDSIDEDIDDSDDVQMNGIII